MSELEQFEPARPRRRSPWPARLVALFFALLGLVALASAGRALAVSDGWGAVVYLAGAIGAAGWAWSSWTAPRR